MAHGPFVVGEAYMFNIQEGAPFVKGAYFVQGAGVMYSHKPHGGPCLLLASPCDSTA